MKKGIKKRKKQKIKIERQRKIKKKGEKEIDAKKIQKHDNSSVYRALYDNSLEMVKIIKDSDIKRNIHKF